MKIKTLTHHLLQSFMINTVYAIQTQL